MFLDFLAAGLVERKQSKVNWDPVDMTVLANEQVIDGSGWRSGAPVEQRELTQWFFKISDYSEDLLDGARQARPLAGKSPADAEELDRPSEGLLVRFALDPKTAPNGENELEIFTTRHDTLFGAKFMAIAPDHPLAPLLRRSMPSSRTSSEQCRYMGTSQAAIDTAEKLGFDTGIKALHPFDASWKLPVYIRQFRFDGLRHRRAIRLPGAQPARPRVRQQISGLGNTPVVCPPNQDPKTFVITDVPYLEDGKMINSRFPRWV